MNKNIIGLGIDQGIANCGFSIIQLTPDNEIILLQENTIQTEPSLPTPQRLKIIYNELSKLFTLCKKEYEPISVMGCERLIFNQWKREENGFRNKSASMMSVNMVTGIIQLLAGKKNVPLYELVPGTVKKHVAGNGRATKEELDEVLRSLLPEGQSFHSNHSSDATGIGITAVKLHKEEISS